MLKKILGLVIMGLALEMLTRKPAINETKKNNPYILEILA
jgi:hypothetical protein